MFATADRPLHKSINTDTPIPNKTSTARTSAAQLGESMDDNMLPRVATLEGFEASRRINPDRALNA